MPAISIIVPVYNVEKYLRECLDSILHWSFNDWEAILIDDGSSDSSGFICDEYVTNDVRFKVIHKQNEGVSVARNAGLDVARGEWCWFVDSDDIIDINTPVDLDRLEGMDLVMFDINMFNDGEAIPYENKKISYETSDDLNLFYQKWISYLHPSIWYNRKFWDRKSKKSVRFTRGIKLGEDLEFMRKCELLSSFPIKVNHTNYYYRIRQGSACRTDETGKIIVNNAFQIMYNILSFIKQHKIEPSGWKTKRIATLISTIPANAIKIGMWKRNTQQEYQAVVNSYELQGFHLTAVRYVWLSAKWPSICAALTKLRNLIYR